MSKSVKTSFISRRRISMRICMRMQGGRINFYHLKIDFLYVHVRKSPSFLFNCYETLGTVSFLQELNVPDV